MGGGAVPWLCRARDPHPPLSGDERSGVLARLDDARVAADARDRRRGGLSAYLPARLLLRERPADAGDTAAVPAYHLRCADAGAPRRSEEHTSELQPLIRL